MMSEAEVKQNTENAEAPARAGTVRDDRPRRANPTEKKAVAYRKDHRLWVAYPHLDRKARPKKKALRNQTYRRQVDRSLRPALGMVEPDIEDFSPAKPLRRKSGWRWSRREAVTLGEWVASKQQARYWMIGQKILRNYRTERHRKRLAPFLESVIQGRSEHSRLLARSFGFVLNWPAEMSVAVWRQSLRSQVAFDCYAWLGALDELFKEQPEFEARFRAWIADLLGDTGPINDPPKMQRRPLANLS